MLIEIRVPPLPESVTDATVAAWRKQPLDEVQQGDPLLDLETDKVVLEIPAPVAGVLQAHVCAVGSVVHSSDLLATLESSAAAPIAAPPPAAAPAPETAAPGGLPALSPLSPSARRQVRAQQQPLPPPAPPLVPNIVTAPPPSVAARVVPLAAEAKRVVTRTPLSRIRQRIAERLLESQQTTATLTTMNEVNLAAVQTLRQRYKESFEKTHRVKLGLMAFFVRAVTTALQRFPILNATLDGNDVVQHAYCDLSIAVSTPRGLVTPVIHNAERLGFAAIEREVARYAERARANSLTLEDLQGGTFSLTNGGVFGSLLSTPILNPPQSAILGMHTIQERPVAENGQVVIRPMMYLALAYDHRLIDGRDAVQGLVYIKELLQAPERLLLEL